MKTIPGADVTIDLNDKTLTAGTSNNYGVIANASKLVVIENGDILSKGGGLGAINGAEVIYNAGKLDVSSTSTSGRYNIYAVGDGTKVTINSGEFTFSSTLNQKRAYIYVGSGAVVYVNGGVFGPASKRDGYTTGILGDGQVIITGGTFGFDPSEWVAEGYEAVKNNGNWVVSAK